MATFPYFVLGPNTIVSMLGLLRGPDTTRPTPPEDWREATVDVVIPAFNEERMIVLCLASLMRQTLRPRRILLIDDGSTDRTVACARAFCMYHGLELSVIQRRKPIGKTPTIKRQARELDCDVEFILDGDTVLESGDYIERTVQELYKAVGIGSACGTILPLRRRDRRASEAQPSVRAFAQAMPWRMPIYRESSLCAIGRGITNVYREVLYLFLQRFIYHGEMVFFGTITNPVGCAVAYRRKYVKDVFDYITPRLGDDLTNSEDIFIGFALLNEGYRNIQLTDVYARTVEPEIGRLPRQVYLWSSSFLQSCYYFDALVRSPFRVYKRWKLRPGGWSGSLRPLAAPGLQTAGATSGVLPGSAVRAGRSHASIDLHSTVQMSALATLPSGGPVLSARSHSRRRGEDRRVVREPYRQAFGRGRTREYGRPVGWMLLAAATEKVFFPTLLLIMMLTGNWHGAGLTVAIETAIGLFALVLVTKGQRVQYFFKGLAVAPIRYAMLGSDLVTFGRFGTDLWLTHNRKWRK